VRGSWRRTGGMLPRRRARLRGDRGFTLIELLVVMAIIGILILIALPTYVGARARAADRAAETDVRTGLVAAMTYYAETGTYTGFTVAEADVAEAQLDRVAPGPPTRGQVAIVLASANDLLLVGLSASGSYVCVAQQFASPLTTTGKGATFADVDTVPECSSGW